MTECVFDSSSRYVLPDFSIDFFRILSSEVVMQYPKTFLLTFFTSGTSVIDGLTNFSDKFLYASNFLQRCAPCSRPVLRPLNASSRYVLPDFSDKFLQNFFGTDPGRLLKGLPNVFLRFSVEFLSIQTDSSSFK